jgi:hypothetical protein
MEVETCLWRGSLIYRGGDLSTKGREGRLVYGGGDSSTEGETRLLRGRLVYGRGDSSIEGKTRLRRGGSSTEGEARLQRGRGCVLLEDVRAISSYRSEVDPPTPFSHICSGNVHLLRPDGPDVSKARAVSRLPTNHARYYALSWYVRH